MTASSSFDGTAGGRRVALVTGAGVRVGAAIAERLASAGIDVAVHHLRSAGEAQALCGSLRSKGVRAEALRADLAEPGDVEALALDVQRIFGGLDYMVLSASIFEKVPFRDVTREAWRRMQVVNCESQAFLVKACLPMLDRSARAAIVMMTDIGARNPWKGFLHYNVSKAGLQMLVKGLALELAPGIRVNGVAPGAVVYPDWYSDEERRRHTSRIPMGRTATTGEIAQTVQFLLEGPGFITGAVVDVDGGRSLAGR